jgi:F0F1-type ATP synthase assembly protein I
MRPWQAALRLIGVGWYVAGAILLGVLAGLWLDNKFDTEPLFVLAGLILGIIVAGYGVYKMLLPLISNKENKEDD